MKNLNEVKNEIARKETTPSVNWDELAPIQRGQLLNVVAIEYAKQFQDELIEQRNFLFKVLKEQFDYSDVEARVKSIDNVLKK